MTTLHFEHCLNPACQRFAECKHPSCCIADAEKDIWNEAIEAAIVIPSNRANEATAIGDERTAAQMRIIMDELSALKRQ